jgi:hypothetical protein
LKTNLQFSAMSLWLLFVVGIGTVPNLFFQALLMIWLWIRTDPHWFGSPGSGSVLGIRNPDPCWESESVLGIWIRVHDQENWPKFTNKSDSILSDHLWPGSGSAWILDVLPPWIWIRFRIEVKSQCQCGSTTLLSRLVIFTWFKDQVLYVIICYKFYLDVKKSQDVSNMTHLCMVLYRIFF